MNPLDKIRRALADAGLDWTEQKTPGGGPYMSWWAWEGGTTRVALENGANGALLDDQFMSIADVVADIEAMGRGER